MTLGLLHLEFYSGPLSYFSRHRFPEWKQPPSWEESLTLLFHLIFFLEGTVLRTKQSALRLPHRPPCRDTDLACLPCSAQGDSAALWAPAKGLSAWPGCTHCCHQEPDTPDTSRDALDIRLWKMHQNFDIWSRVRPAPSLLGSHQGPKHLSLGILRLLAPDQILKVLQEEGTRS